MLNTSYDQVFAVIDTAALFYLQTKTYPDYSINNGSGQVSGSLALWLSMNIYNLNLGLTDAIVDW